MAIIYLIKFTARVSRHESHYLGLSTAIAQSD
jgi:hypothetical protein